MLKARVKTQDFIKIYGVSENGRHIYIAAPTANCHILKKEFEGENIVPVTIYRNDSLIREMELIFVSMQVDEGPDVGSGQIAFFATTDICVEQEDTQEDTQEGENVL